MAGSARRSTYRVGADRTSKSAVAASAFDARVEALLRNSSPVGAARQVRSALANALHLEGAQAGGDLADVGECGCRDGRP
jgi:hypothetical protein